MGRRPSRQGLRGDQAHRRHLRGEPLLRQPLRRLGGRQRAAPTPTPRTRRRSTRPARRTRACCRTTSTSRRRRSAATCTDAPHGDAFDEPVPERAVHDRRRTSRRPTTTCPAPGVFAPNGVLDGHRAARRLHARPRPPLLPGAVPAQRRRAEPLRDRQRRGRPDDGRTTTRRSCRSTSTCTPRPSRLRDRRPLLPGGVRRLVPQPPVADRRGDADVPERAARADLHSMRRRQRDADAATRCTRRPATVRDRALTAPCPPPRPPGLACGDFAVNTIQPAYQPTRRRRRSKLPPQTTPTIGDRLSAKGVDWAWYSGGWSNANGDVDGPGWTNGTAPGTCTDPNTSPARVFPNCPDKLFQFHHQPFNYFASFAPGTPARAAHLRDEEEFSAGAPDSKQPLPAQAGELHQADRRGERAPRLRQRAQRQRPPRRPAAGDPAAPLRQGHDGRRHLRRVRRPVGPRAAARPGQRHPARTTRWARARASRRWSSRPACATTSSSTTSARHDVDHGDDRAPLRPAAGGPRDAAVKDLSSVFAAREPHRFGR